MNISHYAYCTATALAACLAVPAYAQTAQDSDDTSENAAEFDLSDTVYDENWISIGAGIGYSPSYEGSDNYRAFPLPLIQGQIGPVGITPRATGLALDFIPATGAGPDFDLGVVATLNRSRAKLSEIDDVVVERAGELDTAIEVGPTAGISWDGLLNPYDSLTLSVDAKWDIAGAHGGMLVEPGVTYFTPLSRGIAASLLLTAQYGDDDYNDYYYTVDGGQALASGLPLFAADSGFNKLSSTLLLGVDLDGDLANGGLALLGVGGYSRLLSDAKNTPYTSLRGDADQWLIALGVGYTF